MATELGTAFVQIVPSAQGISGSIQSVLAPEADAAGRKGGDQSSKSFASRFMSGVKNASKALVVDLGNGFTNVAAVGASAVAGITASLTQSSLRGGISRAIAVDETRAKFKQLGADVDGMTSGIIAGLGQSKYALNEAGATAVNFYSAGITGSKEMEAAIASVASVASISGKDFNEIGNIYTKVAASGKLTGGVMSQLQENGINANAALQQALGKTSDEITTMVSSGQIDFETFSNAMTAYFGDAGESAMATFSGSLDNVNTVMNRIVASFTGPALEAVRKFFAGNEGQEGLFQALEKIEERLGPVADKFSELAEKAGGIALNAIGKFNDVLDGGGSIMDAFKAAIMELIPDSLKEKFMSLDGGTQTLLGGLGKLLGIVGGGAAIWGVFSGAVTSLIPGLGSLLGPLIGSGGAFKIVKEAGSSVIDIFKLLTGSSSGVTSVFGQLISGLGRFAAPAAGIVAAFVLMYAKSEAFRNAVNNLIQSVMSAVIPIVQAIMPYIQLAISAVMQIANALGNMLAPAINLIAGVVRVVGSIISGLLTTLFPAIKAVVTTVVSIIRVASTVVTTVIGTVKTVALTIWEAIKSKTVTVWNAIKTAIQTPIQTAARIVSTVVATIRSVIEGVSAVVGKVRTTFNNIKEAMAKPIQTARDTIKGIIEKIKGLFPLSIGKIFSNLKLPHISVSGGSAPFGIGGKGSLPKFSVTWNAQGGVYDSASIVGIGVGEAGREIITPETLMRQIIDESNNKNYGVLVRILKVMQYIAESDKSIVMNNREFARLVNEVI